MTLRHYLSVLAGDDAGSAGIFASRGGGGGARAIIVIANPSKQPVFEPALWFAGNSIGHLHRGFTGPRPAPEVSLLRGNLNWPFVNLI